MTAAQTWLLILAVGAPWVVGVTFLVMAAISGVDRLMLRLMQGTSVTWGDGGRRP